MMKTTLKISRLTLLLGIAIWGNHAYAYTGQCSASSDPLVVSSSCEDLNITTSKSSVLIGSGVSITSDPFGNQPAASIGSGLLIPSLTNNGAINSSSFYSGMVVNADTTIGVFTNNVGIATNANNFGPSYNSALELYGKIDTLNNAGTIAATGIRSYGITMGGTASIGALTNQTGQSIAGTASGILMGNGASIGALTNNGYITATNPNTANPTNDGIVSNAITLFNGATLGSLTNSGSITGGVYGLSNQGEIKSLSNSGTMTGGTAGIYNQANTKMGSINNSGSITGTQASTFNSSGISNGGEISSITNSGNITATQGTFRDQHAGIQNLGTASIYTIQNSGSISATYAIDNKKQSGMSGYIGTITNSGSSAALNASSHAINNDGVIDNINNSNSAVIHGTVNAIQNTNQIGQITNSASISGATGIVNDATGSGTANIAAISNSGSIYGDTYAISNGARGVISTITNTATVGSATSGIFGNGGVDINNVGTITTLNNAQSNLVIQGNLPSNYNIIINSPTSYGGLAYSKDATADGTQTNFGIDITRSTIAAGPSSYTTVLNGMTYKNLQNTSGTYRGGFVTTNWNLAPGAFTNQWDLNVNSTVAAPVTSSTSANILANTITTATIAATPISIVAPPSSTTTTTTTTNATGTTTTKQVKTQVSTPKSVLEPTVTTTITTIAKEVGGVTTTTPPVTTTSSAPTTTPAAVPTVKTTDTVTVEAVPTTIAQPTITTTTTSVSTTQAATGPNPIMSNGQSFTANVNALTPGQASQLVLQSNAEGYSSNRTIRLEQMNAVTSTVLDRIDSPTGKGTNTANRVQLDDGRYLWGDIGGSHGNVNNYSGLASFGYNLVDVIIGGDLHRDSQKSYGVFGGVGYSDMANSQTVVQSFNSTSYYLGGYGSYYLPDNLKLSGVGGYVYSSNNSSRSLPTVGGFTGGNGVDSYGSNGIYAAAKVSKDYVINDSFTLVPFAGQSYAQFWTKGVTETGGGDFNVSIASATSYSTTTFAGLDLVMPLVKGVKDPLSLVTFYKFGYDWFANSNSAHSVTATYTNMPLAPQTYVGANMGPISQQIGVGLQGAISKEVSGRIGAVASFNTHGQEYGGGAEIRFKF